MVPFIPAMVMAPIIMAMVDLTSEASPDSFLQASMFHVLSTHLAISQAIPSSVIFRLWQDMVTVMVNVMVMETMEATTTKNVKQDLKNQQEDLQLLS